MIVLGVLAVVVLVALLGFIIHLLWIAFVILLVVWALGFVVSHSHPQRRWYRW